MKKITYYLMALLASVTLFSCQNDDHTLEEVLAMKGDVRIDTIQVGITYSDAQAVITGDRNNIVSTNGAHVIVDATNDANVYVITLSGSTTDGSLKIYGKSALTLRLNGVNLTNTRGAAINNQCHKDLYVICEPGTENVLTDAEVYAEGNPDEDEKGTLFSEGQIHFQGTGALTVNSKSKNAIACDDYIRIADLTLKTNTASTGSHGIKVKEELYIESGNIDIFVAADGAKGIKCDSTVTITGGTTNITTTGAPLIENIDGVADTSSCAAIKCECDFTMTAGKLVLKSTGEGGKGLNSSKDIYFKGGTLEATTSGEKEDASPKAVKADGLIYISGGFFTARSEEGRATDCASKDRFPIIEGTPVETPKLKKKTVIVNFVQKS